MGNRSKADIDIRITIAAGLFAIHTRDAKEIARLVDTSERNIHRWAEREKWEEVLAILGYTGERNFRVRPLRDPERENATVFENVKNAYIAARDHGTPKHKLATLVGKQIGISERKVRYWARKFGWSEVGDF